MTATFIFRETSPVDRSDLVRISCFSAKRKKKRVAIIENGQRGHDRISSLLRQRINPTRHIFHDISPLKIAEKTRDRSGRKKDRAEGRRRKNERYVKNRGKPERRAVELIRDRAKISPREVVFPPPSPFFQWDLLISNLSATCSHSRQRCPKVKCGHSARCTARRRAGEIRWEMFLATCSRKHDLP